MDNPKQEDAAEDGFEAFGADRLTDLLRRARWRTWLRHGLISLLVFSVVAVGGFLLHVQMMNGAYTDAMAYVAQRFQIGEPDVHVANIQVVPGLFGGQMRVQTYKLISGLVVPWSSTLYEYSIWGSVSPWPGDYSPAPQLETPQGIRPYDAGTGQRDMVFYAPPMHYKTHFYDLGLLSQIPAQDRVEMALSFNKAYTFRQVNSLLRGPLRPVWYWVDTFRASHLVGSYPFMPYMVHGFGYDLTNHPTPHYFVDVLRQGAASGLHRASYTRILRTLDHGTGRIDPASIKLFGAVVTGSPAQLMALKGKAFIRAAALGAIARPY